MTSHFIIHTSYRHISYFTLHTFMGGGKEIAVIHPVRNPPVFARWEKGKTGIRGINLILRVSAENMPLIRSL